MLPQKKQHVDAITDITDLTTHFRVKAHQQRGLFFIFDAEYDERFKNVKPGDLCFYTVIYEIDEDKPPFQDPAKSGHMVTPLKTHIENDTIFIRNSATNTGFHARLRP